MLNRFSLRAVIAVAALLALAAPALAGGAAVVSLDSLPGEVRAGQTLHLGFMVLQHGTRPVHNWEGVGPVEPLLTATNKETGETYQVKAQMDATKLGHFTIDVTFPTDGTWEWEIQPIPFEGMNKFDPLTVLPPAAPAVEADPVPASAPVAGLARGVLLVGGGALLIAAAAIELFRRRQRPEKAAAVQ